MAIDPKKLWRFSRNLAMAVTLAVFVALAAWQSWFLIFRTSYFRIARIEVEGARTLDPDLLRSASGLSLDRNVFTVDLADAERRLLEIPRVDFASVEKVGGLDRIRIVVRERVPVALILANGVFYEIDDESTIFAVRDSGIRVDLPIVTGIDLPAVQMGRRLTDLRVVEAVRFVATLPPEHFTRVSEIHFEGPILSLVLVTGEKVYPGDAANFRRLYHLLLATLEKFRHQNVAIRHLDMRFNDEIVVMPANI